MNGEPIYWIDVLTERRERQARILANRRQVGADLWHAVRLWVAYFDQSLMGGWQAFLDDYRGNCLWLDREGKYVELPQVLKLLPFSLFDDWYAWKKAFAAKYERRRQDGKPVGVLFLWQRDRKLALQPTRE
ncbi:MAG: hypothetical protein KGL39_28900 [Patescibacteria group bacterium]|nr:hypothetical protein [Patescibacteria group bacterium]